MKEESPPLPQSLPDTPAVWTRSLIATRKQSHLGKLKSTALDRTPFTGSLENAPGFSRWEARTGKERRSALQRASPLGLEPCCDRG